MKIYVAGKFSNNIAIRQYMTWLEEKNHTITHDWTSYQSDKEAPEEILADRADKDLTGVRDAYMLVAIMDDPDYEFRGTFTEIGMALGLGKRVCIVCPFDNPSFTTNCFFHHPRIHKYKSFEEFIDDIPEDITVKVKKTLPKTNNYHSSYYHH